MLLVLEFFFLFFRYFFLCSRNMEHLKIDKNLYERNYHVYFFVHTHIYDD